MAESRAYSTVHADPLNTWNEIYESGPTRAPLPPPSHVRQQSSPLHSAATDPSSVYSPVHADPLNAWKEINEPGPPRHRLSPPPQARQMRLGYNPGFKQYFEENPEIGEQQHHATTGDTQQPTSKPQPHDRKRKQKHAFMHRLQDSGQEQQHHATTGDTQEPTSKPQPHDQKKKQVSWLHRVQGNGQEQQHHSTTADTQQTNKLGGRSNMKLKWANLGKGTKCMIIFIAVTMALGILWGTVHVTTYLLCKNGTITDTEYCAAIGWSGGSGVTQRLAQEKSSILGNVRSSAMTTEPLQTTGSPVENAYCDEDPCANGGTCHLIDDGYRCECTEEFTGETCDTEIELTSTIATTEEIKMHTPRVAATIRSFSMKIALIISLLIGAAAVMIACFVKRQKSGPRVRA